MINNVHKIRINTAKPYDVLVGKNLIYSVGELIKEVINPCKIAIITDDTVDRLYSLPVMRSLTANGYTVVKFAFKHGEQSKNITTYGEILEFLAENSFTRTDAIVALGGGVVGDLAGFVASTYLRGIKCVQVPTTLLSQIDSSVGGKTAIDLNAGKNLAGAFFQPSMVICDVETLNTLSDEVFSDGMGEAVKYAVLDKDIFELMSAEENNIYKLISLSIDYKRKIVEKDEFEKGDRKLLNLGHTLAHGIEKLSGYTISHGKAVAMGLSLIISASVKHGYISTLLAQKLQEIIITCAGDYKIPFSIDEICEVALLDKKRSGQSIDLVTVHGIGDCRIEKIEIDKLVEFFV